MAAGSRTSAYGDRNPALAFWFGAFSSSEPVSGPVGSSPKDCLAQKRSRPRRLQPRAPIPKSLPTRGLMQTSQSQSPVWHGTTILTVRKGGKVVIGGDGQVSIGQTVIKSNAKKVRKLGKGDVIGGFAGATADAFTLFERLEAKLEQYPGQLTRAAVEPDKDAETIVRRSLDIAADICVYTNRNVTIEALSAG